MSVGRKFREREGSLTVEASLVMGLVLLTLFSVIGLTLWLRDQTAVTAAMAGSLYGRAEEAEESLRMECEAAFFWPSVSHRMQETEAERTAEVYAEAKSLWPISLSAFSVQLSRRLPAPAAVLRLRRSLRELGET